MWYDIGGGPDRTSSDLQPVTDSDIRRRIQRQDDIGSHNARTPRATPATRASLRASRRAIHHTPTIVRSAGEPVDRS